MSYPLTTEPLSNTMMPAHVRLAVTRLESTSQLVAYDVACARAYEDREAVCLDALDDLLRDLDTLMRELRIRH